MSFPNLSGMAEQFSAVWRYFSPVKLPWEQNGESGNDVPPLMRPMMPVFGAVLALCVVVPLYLISVFGRLPAAIVGALLAPLVLEYLTGRAGLNALTHYIESRQAGASQEDALPGKFVLQNGNKGVDLTMVTIYLFRVLFMGTLVWCGASWWIIIALTGGYLVRAEMTTVRDRSGEEFFRTDPRFAKTHWIAAALLMMAATFFCSFSLNLLPALTAFACAWLAGVYAAHLCMETPDGNSRNAMDVFGYAAELLLLLLGVLIYVH